MTSSPKQVVFSEDELLALSVLADLVFCERRAALHQLERLWTDNIFTAEGHILHERTDQPETEVRGDIRIVRGLRLRSLRLGVSGIADVVEFHRVRDSAELSPPGTGNEGVVLPSVRGRWRPFPVEYKRGRLRREEGYEVQLCAQAICMEEMLGATIPAGALFYGRNHRRLNVELDENLRGRTASAAVRLHELVRGTQTPPARYEKKCDSCSLVNLCVPKAMTGRRSVRAYLSHALAEIEPAGE